ncbi:MAG: FAD-binding oxidoreductase [Candidatus Sericytochromatia bacterium]|nr:FAD-binding oxidoreductase [Candidatus Sericytochromatia bacterium]
MAAPTVELSGWGRRPRALCSLYRPEKRQHLVSLLTTGEGTRIARGLGRSYGDQALNPQGVISLERLDRMLSFDDESGVLVCEAGVSLADILSVFLPRGWFPGVTPGTKHVTVGGAIANDVHGKNHHVDGSFAAWTLGFTLLTPAGEVLECSRELNPEVFWATLGGAGLTGVVLLAAIRLRRVTSAFMKVDYRQVANLDDLMGTLEVHDPRHTYSVAWVDALARGRSLGRGVTMHGDHLEAEFLPARWGPPLATRPRGTIAVPCDMPAGLMNRATVGAFNEVFWRVHRTRYACVVPLEPYFYPLDRLHAWNRLYGAGGFVQYQVAFPFATARRGLARVLERLSSVGAASFLAVIKRFGDATPGPLSFPMPGYTLALDLPFQRETPGLLAQLDAAVLEHGGRLYLAKDSQTDARTLRAMYPDLDAFRDLRERLDPDRRLSSLQAVRLGLV